MAASAKRKGPGLTLGEAHAALAPTRVLLAEDNDDMRALLKGHLVGMGYEVVAVSNGQALLDELQQTTRHGGYHAEPHLIITDVRMPGFWGLDVLATLRRGDWSTPVVVITGFGDLETHTEASLLGAAAVFDKPFDLADFGDKVQSIAAP